MKLAEIYGPIFRLSLGGRSVLVLSSFELVNEVCDNERFDKFIGPGLMQARTIAGDGLFTAWTQEPNWKKAHNILTPSFGSMAIRSYLPEMVDIATQLVEKWSRLNPDEDIDVPGDMTRLTLDTIGLCAFSYRFNSFYSERPQPFVAAMQEALSFATSNLSKLPIQRRLMFRRTRRVQEDVSTMNGLIDRLIAERQANADQGRYSDLLQAMLTGVDRESGEKLDMVNVRYQILTFLVAGHETTAGFSRSRSTFCSTNQTRWRRPMTKWMPCSAVICRRRRRKTRSVRCAMSGKSSMRRCASGRRRPPFRGMPSRTPFSRANTRWRRIFPSSC